MFSKVERRQQTSCFYNISLTIHFSCWLKWHLLCWNMYCSKEETHVCVCVCVCVCARARAWNFWNCPWSCSFRPLYTRHNWRVWTAWPIQNQHNRQAKIINFCFKLFKNCITEVCFWLYYYRHELHTHTHTHTHTHLHAEREEEERKTQKAANFDIISVLCLWIYCSHAFYNVENYKSEILSKSIKINEQSYIDKNPMQLHNQANVKKANKQIPIGVRFIHAVDCYPLMYVSLRFVSVWYFV